MHNNEISKPILKPEGGFNFWRNEIIKAGVYDDLRHFNDLLTDKAAPEGYGEPVITDVALNGKICDIYHTDKERTDSGNRIFIHIKE